MSSVLKITLFVDPRPQTSPMIWRKAASVETATNQIRTKIESAFEDQSRKGRAPSVSEFSLANWVATTT